MKYINYHSHTMYSNISTPDSTITNRDRAERANELSQGVLTSTEHGWCGRVIETIELGKEFGLKPLIAVEAYFVKNRFEKDRTNAHLMLLAKNDIGRKAINKALSEANLTGYYYKPRLDLELIFNLPKDDVWVTSACLGGLWKYEDEYENLVNQFYDYFGNNFFLEVQAHNTQRQKDLNLRILELSHRYNIKIIAGMDSHMIYPNQTRERDNYIASRGIEYPDEEGWYLDFPTYDEAFDRFKIQGILNKYQIEEALGNTNTFDEVEEYQSIYFNDEIIKLPTLYPEKNQEEKDLILRELIYKEWEKEKENIPQDRWAEYEEEIEKELATVINTRMSDYFLLDYEVVKRGKNLGGSITLTGRGSAAGFYLSKLLGFTTIDRINSSVKLFPERFISEERLLSTKSIPDIDFNLGNPEIFAQAQIDVMGEGRSYPMIAFGTTKAAGAWKLYARVSGVDFDTSNNISKQIKKYELSKKHNEDASIFDFIDEEYHKIFKESKKYVGIVNSITVHPCAFLLTDDDIKEEFGLMKIKTGNTENICACVDGHFAEKYKMLKNDLLKVSVVDLIYQTYKRINKKPHTVPELISICENNNKVWDIYKIGATMGINQVEQYGTKARAIKYSPKNIAELSAFVAAIRPGFQSNYKQFEAREPFEYGINALDNLIQTKDFPYSYMLYQENAMQVLAYAGIPLSQTYDVVKNIAKKRHEKVYAIKEKFIEGMKHKIIDDEGYLEKEAEKISNDTWQIIEDSAHYSFNSAHSYSVAGDSIYGAYLKSHYPVQFYETFLKILEEDGDKDRLADAKVEAEKYFNIKFPPLKFGQDNRSIVGIPEKNEITSSLKTLKGFGGEIGEELYEAGCEFGGKTFIDFLIYAEEKNIISKKWDTLIKINYFEQFGNNKKLTFLFDEFKSGKFRYKRNHSDKTKEKRITELYKIENELPNDKFSFIEQLMIEEDILGYIQATLPKLDKRYVYVKDVDTKYAPRFTAYCINNGKQISLKTYKKQYDRELFLGGDILYIEKFEKKQPVKFVDGNYIENPDAEPQIWATNYRIVSEREIESKFKGDT